MELKDRKISNWVYVILIGLIMAAGIALRVYVYGFGRSLWLDEAALANNLLEPNTILDNMHYQQAAPPLFKLISLAMFNLFGQGWRPEFALRAFPLFCGLLSIPLFFVLVNKIFESKVSKIIATALFSINYNLIYYSSEFKQYSSDVMVALLLLLSGAFINPFKCSRKTLLALAIFYAISFWLSHTALFMLAGLFLFYFFYYENSKRFWMRLFALFSPAGLSFCAFYFLHLKTLSQSEFMHTYWADYFLSDFSKGFHSIISYLMASFDQKFIFGIVCLVLAGVYLFYRKTGKSASLLLFPLLVLFGASVFSFYPVASRLCLFILPVFIAIVSVPFGFVRLKKTVTILFAALICFVSFNSYFMVYPKIILKKNIWYREEIRQLYDYLKTAINKDDVIVVTDRTHQADRFYQRLYNFENNRIIIWGDRNAAKMASDADIKLNFDVLEAGKRYWVVFTGYEYKKFMLGKIVDWISKNAIVLDQYEYYSSYLFYIQPK